MDPARQPDAAVARPLHVLVPLIRRDLQDGRDAERAGLSFYQAAGEKLLEAKTQIKHGDFLPCVKINFNVSPRMARHYMQLAEQTADKKGNAFPFSSLRDFIRQTRRAKTAAPPPPPFRRVDPFVASAGADERLKEHHAQRQLQLRMISAGYKVLAKKLHPDTGGTTKAMAQLNRARDDLRELVSS